MERTKMSAQDYRETEGILVHLQTINKVFLVFECMSLVLIYLAMIGSYLENELCENILGFLSKHDTILMVLGVGIAIVTILYYVFLMKIPFHGTDFLLAGIVGFVGLLYEGKNSTTVSGSSGSSLTSAVTAALVSVAIIFIFRKLYCDAMCKMTEDVPGRAGKAWKGLWSLSRISCILSAILIIVLKFYAQGLYDSLDRWSDDYELAYNTFMISAVVIAAASIVIEVILRVREISCLKITHEEVYSKRNSTQSPGDYSRPSGTTRQSDMLRQYDMPEDAPEEDDSWLRKKD